MDYESTHLNGKKILASSPKQDRDYRIIAYDFKRPDMFSLDQIRTIFVLHEIFAQKVSLTLSGMLRKKVSMEVNSVDQMTYGEFIQSIPVPSTNLKIDMAPLVQPALLQFDPQIIYNINDRLFGGSGSNKSFSGELSIIEKSVIMGISNRLMISLKDSWAKIIDLEPIVDQIETQPDYISLTHPSEMIFLVSFKINLGDVSGFINFCVPYLTIESVISKFSAEYWYSKSLVNNKETINSHIVSSIKLDSELVTKTQDISLKQLGGLKKGSLIKLDGFNKGETTLRMGGEHLLKMRIIKKRFKSEFQIESEDLVNSNIGDVLKKSNSKKESQEIMEHINDISNKVSKLSDNFIKKIDELTNNQDHINDQLLLGITKESTIIDTVDPTLSFISHSDIDNVFQIISDSHPQLIALILSRIDPLLSARLLELFSPEKQTDIISRISGLVVVAPETISIISKILSETLKTMVESNLPDVKGIEIVSGILNSSSRSVEKNVIESLESLNSELAESIKNRMFVFEDIVLLEKKSIGKIIEKVDKKDFYLSMKMVNPEVTDFVYNSIPADQAKLIRSGVENLGRVKISDIEKAQLKVVFAIRDMESDGEILVCHPDEIVE